MLLWHTVGNAQSQITQATEAGAVSPPPGVILQNSPRLEEKISDSERKNSPVHVQGLGIKARPDLDLIIQGNATLRKQGLTVRSDRIEYDQ